MRAYHILVVVLLSTLLAFDNVEGKPDRPREEPPCKEIRTTTCRPPRPPPCRTTTTTCRPPQPPCRKTTTTCRPPRPPPCRKTTTTCRPPRPPPCRKTTTTCRPPRPPPCRKTTTTCRPPRPPPCRTTTTTCRPTTTTTLAPLVPPEEPLARVLASTHECRGVDDGAYFADRRHCRRFYVCLNNRARRQNCRNGEWFDRQLKTCQPRSLVSNCLAQRN